MGTCVSSHRKCCTSCFRVSEESNKSTRGKRRSIKWFSSKKSIDSVKSGKLDISLDNPHIQGGNEEKWFDSTARFDSDSEEEFHSIRNVSSGTLLQRPLAGSQFPFSPIEKKVFGSWSHIEPGSFRVRAKNYLRDKKKALSSNYAAYHPFGVDVFLSQRKVDHIARFVQLPLVKSQGEFPPILVVNVQIPLYSPTIFQSENDGQGMSVVLYFKLSENYSKEIASHFLENFRRVINNEVENLQGFAIDAIIPIRERLKILGRVANVDDLQLNAAERKLMHAYNEKPILSRPQHEFYLGEDYFEIDLDMHRFSYISRKGFDAFQDRLKHCILDLGLTIQGNKAGELPEQILCCIRLNGIDHTKYHKLESNLESL